MFSYRHAFHAGNHADVFKHLVLHACLDHLRKKETPLTLIDTHAGVGLYRLDGDYAQTSQESAQGVIRLLQVHETAEHGDAVPPRTELLTRYVSGVLAFNPGIAVELDRDAAKPPRLVYPGSPAIMQYLMRPQDQMQLFELQAADMRALDKNLAQGRLANRIHVRNDDGFAGSLRLLPPPSRRALVLCDPSYEIKTDYAQVAQWLALALSRFATGMYLVWYPIIPRPEAHALPRKLKSVAAQAGKPWLHATFAVRGGSKAQGPNLPGQKAKRPGLGASGMVAINPPYTLAEQLALALPELVAALGQDHFATYQVEHGGAE